MAEYVTSLSATLGPFLHTFHDSATRHESGRATLHIPGAKASVLIKYGWNINRGNRDMIHTKGVLAGCDASQLCEAILTDGFCKLVLDTGDAVMIDIKGAELTSDGVWAAFEVIGRC